MEVGYILIDLSRIYKVDLYEPQSPRLLNSRTWIGTCTEVSGDLSNGHWPEFFLL
jgi:hypothetical protein